MTSDGLAAFRRQVEAMIGSDRLGDAIDSMLAVTQSGPYRNELIGHMAGLSRLDRAARLGIDTDRNQEERRRLRYVLLELLEEILEDSSGSDLPVLQNPIDAEVPDQTSLEKIIGANNLKNIAWLELGLKCSMAVGRIVTPDGMGTGFLVRGALVVTNSHVLPTADVAEQSSIDFNYQQDVNGKMLKHFRYRFDRDRFRSNREKDVAVIGVRRVSDLPDVNSWGWLVLNDTGPPAVGDHVSIIQHPSGGPKQIACTANQVVNVFEHRLQYLTDTLPGSSGAPVFDDKWTVVAVHHAGGNLKANARGDTRYVNEGILTNFVKDMFSEHKT